MARGETESTDWQAVLARATAFLCLQRSGLDSASMLERAEFLMRFGLSRPDAARLLGTTEASLRVLAGRRGKRTTHRKPASKAKSKTTRRRSRGGQ
jgi:hypothetical protein